MERFRGVRKRERAMLKWCSYCQEFMREISPYDDFGITHGLCTKCESSRTDLFAKDEVERAHALGGIFHALFDAGRHEDFKTGERLVEEAIAASCRPVDILIGMIAPMLYEIGEEWKRGSLSVEAEHRFTAFSKRVIDLVEAKITASAASASTVKPILLFLMNAPGNRHNLAVRILALWLRDRGAAVKVIDDQIDTDSLMRSIAAERPKYLLISMALTDQCKHVALIAKATHRLPQAIRPRLVVGGYPVKAGLVQSIPSAELVSDISALEMA